MRWVSTFHRAPPRRSVGDVQEATGYHLVELRRPAHGWEGLQALAARARAAAEAVDSPETPVRFLRSIFVPDDDACFQLFRGTQAAVAETLTRAGLSFEGGIA
jgi:hypothetical protein